MFVWFGHTVTCFSTNKSFRFCDSYMSDILISLSYLRVSAVRVQVWLIFHAIPCKIRRKNKVLVRWQICRLAESCEFKSYRACIAQTHSFGYCSLISKWSLRLKFPKAIYKVHEPAVLACVCLHDSKVCTQVSLSESSVILNATILESFFPQISTIQTCIWNLYQNVIGENALRR